MEDLLVKDIFCDGDLKKLSPDYNPLNVLMRMQVRRSLMKDRHSHGLHKSISNKKNSSRTPKNNIQCRNELTKLKQMFQSKNLNNDILIKNSHSIRNQKYQNKQKLRNHNMKNINEKLKNDTIMYENFTEQSTECGAVEYHKKCDDFDDVLDGDKDTGKSSLMITNYIEDTDVIKELPIENINIISIDDNNINNNSAKTRIDNLQSTIIKTVISSRHRIDSRQDISNIVEQQKLISERKEYFRKHISRQEEINVNDEEVSATVNDSERKQFELVIPMPYNYSEDYLIVEKRPKELNITTRALVHKYVTKWKAYTNKKREERLQEREMVIKNFLENLEKKKLVPDGDGAFTKRAKLQAKDYITYRHRYKVQQNIIALQKAKLEQQNRVIEELKYNKILEVSRNSVDELREQLRNNYYEIDRSLKPKIKCLTNELNIPEVSDATLALQCLKVPQFLKQMEKRAREREEKHAIIRERRKQMEEERERLKQQAEVEKAQMDKEEKMRILKELREKRKKEKIESIRRKRNAERMRALIVMADLHYERKIIVKYGMDPWKQLIQLKSDNIEKAKYHFKFQLVKNTFLSWMWHTEDMWYERNYRAEEFRRKKLLRKVFDGLKQNYYDYILKKQVAEDYYELYLVQFAFRLFRRGVEEFKRENEIKWQRAVAYYNGNLKFKLFVCWRSLPAINALQREQEVRKARWRHRVLQVVPDYTPPDE